MKSYMKKYTNYLSIFFCLLLLVAFAEKVQGQKTIIHKTGPFYTDYMSNGMQKTHINRTTIYALPTATSVVLTVPPELGGNPAPHAYYRWYNYITDGLSTTITPNVTYTSGTNGRYLLNNNSLAAQQAKYNFSTGGASVVACDVSAYNDYIDGSTTFTEPTLSYRCIFDIRNAKEIADSLANLATGRYLEEHTVYMPSTKIGSENSRVCLQYDRTNYYGYTTTAKSTMTNGNFTISGTSSDNGRRLYVAPQAAGNTQIITVTMTCGSGSTAQTYRIAKFTIVFVSDLPMKYSALTGVNEKRSINYLDKNYVLLSKLDFDYNTKPATEDNNMWSKPLEWDICSYGFASRELYLAGNRTAPDYCTADWNEYGFYKTANIFTNKYTWWNQSGQKVYDRRYYDSNKAENGYFFYVDASDKPGTIAKLRLEDKLCAGTKLLVSAGICNMAGSGSDADVNFIFKGIDADGTETELHRFTSGDITKTTISEAEWYQVYYSFSYNTNVDYDHYILQIDNNASSTSGGDYAVDDIRIYRSKPTVQANQVTLPCGSEDAKVKIRVEYAKLLSTLGKTETTVGAGENLEVNYKFLDSSKTPMVYNYNTLVDTDINYGVVKISTNFNTMTVLSSTLEAPVTYSKNPVLAYTETETIDGVTYRYIVFQTPNNNSLKVNGTYYTAIANSSGIFGTGTCDMISDPFTIIPPSDVTVDGASWKSGNGMCYGNEIIIGAKLRDRITHEDIVCRFDWYLGSKEEFSAIPNGGMSVGLALQKYREAYPNPTNADTELSAISGDFNQDAYAILQNLIIKKRLILNQKEIIRLIRLGESLLAIPIIATAEKTSTTTTLELCSDYIPIDATEPHKNPTIELGRVLDKPISLRMGLKQFGDLKNNFTKSLTIPVRDFKNADQSKTRNLVKASDTNVYLISTDDPAIQNVDSLNPSILVANIETIHVTTDTGDTDYFALKIPSGSITVKEGYTYKMEFHFNQERLLGDEVSCDGVTAFYIKIVPEYLTWTGVSGDNWNNDVNWKRSEKNELYKNTLDTYTDDLNSHGFVPMNFSKVIIANVTTKAPWLYRLTGSPVLAMENTNYTDYADIKSNSATTDIAYDLVVTTNGTNYDCSPFYGNTCDQIYFKPAAEMRNTNYLTYNRAWVDFELTSGRWYMLTSPLKAVFAGDMYLPTISGRQETEAFQPITYSTITNNRFNPAIYQRSWDHSSSTVFNVGGDTDDSYISADWSQVYNKVDEAYTPGKGFSIRPVYGTEGVDEVLFRLPKEDVSYDYYSYDGTVSGNNTPISRTDNGKLVFESNASDVEFGLTNTTTTNNIFLIGNPFMATLDMKKFFDAHSDFERRFWILTGNGQNAVAIADDGTLTTTGNETLAGTIAPMQSFFVEKKSYVTADPIVTFTPNMTISKPIEGSLVWSVNTKSVLFDDISCLHITAERHGQFSNILIKQQENASDDYDAKEDVPVLMDSNLTDDPILYSMAGNHAVMINVIPALRTIPLGIHSDNDNEVTLTFSGLENFGGSVELYDTLLNKTIILEETNATIAVPGNTHDRYFLNLACTDSKNAKITIYSPENGKVIVATSSSDKLQKIQVYNLNGMLLKVLNTLNTIKTEFDLPGGAYIIRVQSQDSSETKKIYCR